MENQEIKISTVMVLSFLAPSAIDVALNGIMYFPINSFGNGKNLILSFISYDARFCKRCKK